MQDTLDRLQKSVDRLAALDNLSADQQADILIAKADILLGMAMIERLGTVTSIECGTF